MDLNAYSPLVIRDLRNLEQDFNTKYREIEQKRDTRYSNALPPHLSYKSPHNEKRRTGTFGSVVYLSSRY